MRADVERTRSKLRSDGIADVSVIVSVQMLTDVIS